MSSIEPIVEINESESQNEQIVTQSNQPIFTFNINPKLQNQYQKNAKYQNNNAHLSPIHYSSPKVKQVSDNKVKEKSDKRSSILKQNNDDDSDNS